MRSTERVLFEKEVSTKLQGRYKTRIFDANSELVYEQPDWAPNLILDCGLDKIAHMSWANVFQFAVAGTGTTPTKVDTSSNASQSGTTVTINSGAFTFTTDHVGKLIYWPGSDSYAKISSFTSSTQVQVDRAQTVSSALFYIYNVDQTALDTPYSMHCRYVPGSGLCGTQVVGNTVKLLRTFDFYLESAPVLITEVGFKDAPASDKLFSRVVLQEPQYLAAGQYFQISYELSVTLEPSTPTTRTVDVSGWPISPSTSVSGTEMIQSLGMAVVNLSGVTEPYDQSFVCNEPFAPGTTFLGPQYGYVNRWQNGAGTPVKSYPALSANPFAYNRNFSQYYQDSPTGSYIPRVSAAALNGATYTNAYKTLIDTDVNLGIWPQFVLALSAEYPQPIVAPPTQWGKLNSNLVLSAVTWTSAVSGSLLNASAIVSYAAFDTGVTASGSNNMYALHYTLNQTWPSKIITRTDGTHYTIASATNSVVIDSRDLVPPISAAESSNQGQNSPAVQTMLANAAANASAIPPEDWALTSGESFNLSIATWIMPPYDPQVEFPNPNHIAEFDWSNWTHTFSVSASGLPVAGSSVFLSTASAAPTTFGSCVDRSAINTEIPLTVVPYVSGSFERIKKGTFLTNLGNRTDWRTIGVGPTDVSIAVTDRTAASKYNGYIYVFDEPQTKLNTHILNVFFKYSWRRDLST